MGPRMERPRGNINQQGSGRRNIVGTFRKAGATTQGAEKDINREIEYEVHIYFQSKTAFT